MRPCRPSWRMALRFASAKSSTPSSAMMRAAAAAIRSLVLPGRTFLRDGSPRLAMAPQHSRASRRVQSPPFHESGRLAHSYSRDLRHFHGGMRIALSPLPGHGAIQLLSADDEQRCSRAPPDIEGYGMTSSTEPTSGSCMPSRAAIHGGSNSRQRQHTVRPSAHEFLSNTWVLTGAGTTARTTTSSSWRGSSHPRAAPFSIGGSHAFSSRRVDAFEPLGSSGEYARPFSIILEVRHSGRIRSSNNSSSDHATSRNVAESSAIPPLGENHPSLGLNRRNGLDGCEGC